MRNVLLALSVVAVVALAGCGGGGSGTASRSAKIGLFVTDSFRDDYAHVWTNILKVEVVSSTTSATLFDDAAGRLIDLKTLRDATGARFSFLSTNSIPIGTWSSVRVTVSPTLSLILKGATTGTSFPLADTFTRDLSGNAQIVFNLSTARPLNDRDDFVIDFDLANFAVVGGKIVASVKEGGHTGLTDPNRHEVEDYEGTVSGLTGTSPDLTFTLTKRNLSTIVTTSATTTIFNSNAAPSPSLANGQKVQVRGKMDTVTNQLAATSVKIKVSGGNGGGNDSPEVKGAPSSPNSVAGTFVLTTNEVHGFVPLTTSVNVVLSSTAVLRASSGLLLTQADFFTRLASATYVEVEGSYDSGTNTLTATRAKFDDGDHDNGGGSNGGGDHGGGGAGSEVEAKGLIINLNTADFSFTLSPVNEYDGFVLTGTSVAVVSTATSTYKNSTGNVTAANFFIALNPTAKIKVEGSFAGSTLTAKKISVN